MSADRCCEHTHGVHYCAPEGQPRACSKCACKDYYSIEHKIDAFLERVWPQLHRECNCDHDDSGECPYYDLARARHDLVKLVDEHAERVYLEWA